MVDYTTDSSDTRTDNDDRSLKVEELGAHRGVSRIAAILEAVAASDGGLRLMDLTKIVGAPKSSLHGFLRGLVSVGYLTEYEGVYSLGVGLGVLIERMAPSLVKAAVLPELRRLVEETSETAFVGMRVGNSIVYLESVGSPHRIRYVPPLMQRRQLLRTSIGKLYLAQLSDGELARIMTEIAPAHSAEERVALLRDANEIRAGGVAFNVNATVDEVSAAASAIRSRDGIIIGGLAIAGPSSRVLPRLKEIAERVKAAAERASLSFTSGSVTTERWPDAGHPTGFGAADRDGSNTADIPVQVPINIQG